MTTATQNMEVEGRNSYKAGAAITANRLVKYAAALDSDGNVNIIPTAGITDIAIGVSLETVANGEMCPVQTKGVAKIEAASAITYLDQLMPDAGGGGKVATAAGATAVNIGQSENAPGGAGELAQVRINLPNLRGPVQT